MVEQQLTDDILAGNENHPGEGKWYIIHCYSGMEERIRKSLEQRIASMDVEDKVFEEALEAGADDFAASNSEFILTAAPSETVNVADTMGAKGYDVVSSAVEMVPKNIMNVSGDDVKKLINMMELLEDHDDIQNIYSNFEIDESEL